MTPRFGFIASAIAIVTLGAALRVAWLRSDPPAHRPIGIIWHDEGAWTHNARNRALWGVWRTDNWNPVFVTPVFTALEFGAFELFGVGVDEGQAGGVVERELPQVQPGILSERVHRALAVTFLFDVAIAAADALEAILGVQAEQVGPAFPFEHARVQLPLAPAASKSAIASTWWPPWGDCQRQGDRSGDTRIPPHQGAVCETSS